MDPGQHQEGDKICFMEHIHVGIAGEITAIANMP